MKRRTFLFGTLGAIGSVAFSGLSVLAQDPFTFVKGTDRRGIESLEALVSEKNDVKLDDNLFPRLMRWDIPEIPDSKGVFGYITMLDEYGHFVAPTHNFFYRGKRIADDKISYYDSLSQELRTGELLGYVKSWDIALGKLDHPVQSPRQTLSITGGLELDTVVYVPYYPNRQLLHAHMLDRQSGVDLSTGEVQYNLLKTKAHGTHTYPNEIQVLKTSRPMDSGTPVYGERGHLRGIIRAIPIEDPTLGSFAVSSNLIRKTITSFVNYQLSL